LLTLRSFIFYFLFSNSYVTREQKALVKAYAETDKEINGTVEGLTETTTGK
jgi:hypothetical protein